MAAVWSGVLTIGLVTLPVGLYSATESHTIEFRQLQRGTSDRIRNRRVNERTGEEVPAEEVVKGYDVGGDYVVVEPKELEEIAPGRSKALDVRGFVDLAEVDEIYFDRTYYLAPRGREYAKVYALLHQALGRTHRAGIATMVMRGREYLLAIKAEHDVLAAHTLHWADEIRHPHRELPTLPDQTVDLGEQELRMAEQLVETLSIDWNPQEYHDTYQERVRELVEVKAAGETVEKAAPPPRSTKVADLMAALEASIAQSGNGKKATSEERQPPTQLEDKRQARKTGKQELERMTKKELYHRATEADIPGRSTMTRDELIKALTGSSRHKKRAKSKAG